MFRTFEHTAFRLETRDRYNAPYEAEPLRRFLEGRLDTFAWGESWLGRVRAATAVGRCFHRVRVVSVPLGDYSRFGLWSSQFNNAAGEDIRYLERAVAENVGLPAHDYWLFDSKKLIYMRFGEDDRFLGGELVDDAARIVQANYWRDVAWRHAIRREDFAAAQG